MKPLFLQMTEIAASCIKRTKFPLGFVTLLLSVVAGSHMAIAQTSANTQNQYRRVDRVRLAHQHLSNPELGSSKNFNPPKGLIAGDKYHDKDGENHDGKPTSSVQHQIMPKPPIDNGSGGIKHVQGHIPMPNHHIDDGSGDRHHIMPNRHIDDGSGTRKNSAKTAPKH